ncbi:MAG: cyclic nucleotide-binding domain-containing protein [Treponema sp.]|jgi:CRP-like cAMP-binding protein|nr:cyclic nucleotide-binding domain-containing protein [Treponema sp.]
MEIESSHLRRHSFFGGLMEGQIEALVPLMQIENFEEGDCIIQEGQPNDKIYFILEGRAEALKKGVRLFVFEEGTTFGEMEVLDIMATEATIRCLAPTRVMFLSNRALRSLHKSDIETFSILIMNLARDISRRLRNMNSRFAQANSYGQ